MYLRIIILLLCWLVFHPASAYESLADEIIQDITLPSIPNEKIILTISTANGDKQYTVGDIETLGLKQLKTTTFWHEDDGVYEGVLLSSLLADAQIDNSAAVSVTALDGYTAVIPHRDWQEWPVIVATRRDGKPLSVRNKGPTRIIYPKDLGGEIANPEMRIRWVWAISKIRPKM